MKNLQLKYMFVCQTRCFSQTNQNYNKRNKNLFLSIFLYFQLSFYLPVICISTYLSVPVNQGSAYGGSGVAQAAFSIVKIQLIFLYKNIVVQNVIVCFYPKRIEFFFVTDLILSQNNGENNCRYEVRGGKYPRCVFRLA